MKWRTLCWICDKHLQKMHFIQPRQLGPTLSMKLSTEEEDAITKDTRSKKGIIGSLQRGNHNVLAHWRDCLFYTIRRLDHGRWQNSHELDSKLSDEDIGGMRNNVMFTKIYSSVTEAEIIAQTFPNNLLKLVKIYNGITTQALLIAQKRTEWQKEQFAERKKQQLSHACNVAVICVTSTTRWPIRQEIWPEVWRTINSFWNIGWVHSNYGERQVKSTPVWKENDEIIFPDFGFPCANGTLRLLNRPRPLLQAEGNPEPEHDVGIKEGGTQKKEEDSWSMRGELNYLHHEEPRLNCYDPDNEIFPIPLKYERTRLSEYYKRVNGRLTNKKTRPDRIWPEAGKYFPITERAEESAKLQAARRNGGIYEELTKITSRWLPTLIWNWKKTLFLHCRALRRMTADGNHRQLQLQWIQIQKYRSMRASQATTCGPHRRKKGYVRSFHHGLVHKPASGQEDLKVPEAKAPLDKECKKLKTISAWDVKKARPKSEVIRQAEKDWNEKQFTSQNFQKSVRNTRSELCSRETTSKTMKRSRAVFTEQRASASQMVAAPRQSFLVWLEKKLRNFSKHSSQKWPKLPVCYKCRWMNAYIWQDVDDQIYFWQLTLWHDQ